MMPKLALTRFAYGDYFLLLRQQIANALLIARDRHHADAVPAQSSPLGGRHPRDRSPDTRRLSAAVGRGCQQMPRVESSATTHVTTASMAKPRLIARPPYSQLAVSAATRLYPAANLTYAGV
jgi:hypothetical protein